VPRQRAFLFLEEKNSTLVLRFICSVTYFLGRFAHGVVQFAEQCGEILSCEPPLEGFGDGLVVTRECQQALRQLLQGREVVGRQNLALEDREIDFDLIEPTGVNGPRERAPGWDTSSEAFGLPGTPDA